MRPAYAAVRSRSPRAAILFWRMARLSQSPRRSSTPQGKAATSRSRPAVQAVESWIFVPAPASTSVSMRTLQAVQVPGNLPARSTSVLLRIRHRPISRSQRLEERYPTHRRSSSRATRRLIWVQLERSRLQSRTAFSPTETHSSEPTAVRQRATTQCSDASSEATPRWIPCSAFAQERNSSTQRETSHSERALRRRRATGI